MGNLSHVGRVLYGLAMAETGLQTIYYHDFPYWLIPDPLWLRSVPIVAYVSGALLMLAGTGIILRKKTGPIALLAGGVFMLIFVFCFIPAEFLGSNYADLAEWENAEKELAFGSGALVIAGSFSDKIENRLQQLLAKLIPFGTIFFSIPMISFGILHLLYAEQVSTMVPPWIPNPLFWAYFAGVALIGSGSAIIFRTKVRLTAALLGAMILSWFIILHIPRVITSSSADFAAELTSAFLALAYSGTAFFIGGTSKT